jgi:hypothetical protein
MNTHGIVGQPWQFAAGKDLKAIVLPLTGGWVSGDSRGWPPHAAHPEQTWDSDLWVIVLDVEAIL